MGRKPGRYEFVGRERVMVDPDRVERALESWASVLARQVSGPDGVLRPEPRGSRGHARGAGSE